MLNFLKSKSGMILTALFCCILWGSAFAFIKIGYIQVEMPPGDTFGKILFAGIRFFMASSMLFAVSLAIHKKKIFANFRNNVKTYLVLGLLSTFIQYTTFYIGIFNTSGAKAAIIISSGTFMILILSHFAFKNDKITIQKAIGFIMGFAGIILVNIFSKNMGSGFRLDGEGLIFICALASAISTIIIKKSSVRINPLILTTWQMLLGSLMLLSVGFAGTGFTVTFSLFPGLITVIYLAFVSAVGFSLWNTLLKYHKASVTGLYKFSIPLFGTTFSILILGEKFNYILLISVLMVSLGIFIINFTRPNRSLNAAAAPDITDR